MSSAASGIAGPRPLWQHVPSESQQTDGQRHEAVPVSAGPRVTRVRQEIIPRGVAEAVDGATWKTEEHSPPPDVGDPPRGSDRQSTEGSAAPALHPGHRLPSPRAYAGGGEWRRGTPPLRRSAGEEHTDRVLGGREDETLVRSEETTRREGGDAAKRKLFDAIGMSAC